MFVYSLTCCFIIIVFSHVCGKAPEVSIVHVTEIVMLRRAKYLLYICYRLIVSMPFCVQSFVSKLFTREIINGWNLQEDLGLSPLIVIKTLQHVSMATKKDVVDYKMCYWAVIYTEINV